MNDTFEELIDIDDSEFIGSTTERQARMSTYLKETHESFKAAVSKSLSKSADGVLAGPTVQVLIWSVNHER